MSTFVSLIANLVPFAHCQMITNSKPKSQVIVDTMQASPLNSPFTSYLSENVYLLKVKNKRQKKVWNMFKVNSKDTKTTSMTSLNLNILHTFF